MNLDELLAHRADLLKQLQAIDQMITSNVDVPWLPMAAAYIRTNQPVMAHEIHTHTYELCQQANLPAPSFTQLRHTLSAHGFRRVRKTAGIYWSSPAS